MLRTNAQNSRLSGRSLLAIKLHKSDFKCNCKPGIIIYTLVACLDHTKTRKTSSLGHTAKSTFYVFVWSRHATSVQIIIPGLQLHLKSDLCSFIANNERPDKSRILCVCAKHERKRQAMLVSRYSWIWPCLFTSSLWSLTHWTFQPSHFTPMIFAVAARATAQSTLGSVQCGHPLSWALGCLSSQSYHRIQSRSGAIPVQNWFDHN